MATIVRSIAAAVLLVPAAATAQDSIPSPIPPPELVRRLGSTLDSLARLDRFSGVAVLAKNGRLVFQRAYGLADRTSGRRNTPATAFNLGSLNKLFTTIAIRQLAAAGRLDLDSTLAAYWHDYPNAEVARRVTIRQLLRHESGIGGDIFDPPAGGRRHDLRHNRDFLPLFVGEPLQFEPGSRREYSNAGYVILGMLVERLSGEDYYDYVARHVYGPAGMTHTGHFAVDSLPPYAAIGYTRSPGLPANSPLRANTAELPGRGSAAGGGYATAGDLIRFLQALRERRIPSGLPPGLGAAGGAPGLNSAIEGDLPGGYDLVVLANLDPPAAERVAVAVRGWLGSLTPSRRSPHPAPEIPLPSAPSPPRSPARPG